MSLLLATIQVARKKMNGPTKTQRGRASGSPNRASSRCLRRSDVERCRPWRSCFLRCFLDDNDSPR